MGQPTLKAAKDQFLALLNLPVKRRLVGSLFHNAITTSSDREVGALEEFHDSMDWLQVLLEDRIRRIKFSGLPISSKRWNKIESSLMESDSPWDDVSINPVDIPGMISDEEARYYEYIGRLYEGRGDLIELGPWLGKSTTHIVRGLERNPKFADKKLHVFDDFVWRTSWMNRHAKKGEQLPNHADFRRLFEKYTSAIAGRLDVVKAKIADHDGNESLPKIGWRGTPIEMMYIDCGRTLHVNEAWLTTFSPSLIPDVSLLIMQDWRTHRERPRLWYNQTLQFTFSHPELELVHEVKEGGIATFIYRGAT